jgi:cell division protein FtsB
MKLQISVGKLDISGETIGDILAKARAMLVQKQSQLAGVETKYKTLKKEAAQLEAAVKQLEVSAPQVQTPEQKPTP